MPTPTRKCLHCRKTIRRRSPQAKYCNKACSNAYRAKKKLKSRTEGFSSTAFGKWLMSALKQAGTVAVLTDVNIEELYSLWKQCREYNGYGHNLPKTELYQLSHIAPSNGVGVVGLLHPKNLVVAPASYNFRRRRNWDEVSGKYINRFDINPTLNIYAGDDSAAIIKKIVKVLGKQFDEFLTKHKLDLTLRAKLVKKLKNLGCNADEQMSLEELKTLEPDHSNSFDSKEHQGFKLLPLGKSAEWVVFENECMRLGAALPLGSTIGCTVIDWDYLHSTFEQSLRVSVWKDAVPATFISDDDSGAVFVCEGLPAGFITTSIRASEYDPSRHHFTLSKGY